MRLETLSIFVQSSNLEHRLSLDLFRFSHFSHWCFAVGLQFCVCFVRVTLSVPVLKILIFTYSLIVCGNTVGSLCLSCVLWLCGIHLLVRWVCVEVWRARAQTITSSAGRSSSLPTVCRSECLSGLPLALRPGRARPPVLRAAAGGSECPCAAPGSERGLQSGTSTVTSTYDVNCRKSKFSGYSFLPVFNINGFWILSGALSLSVDKIMCFLFVSLLIG